MEAQVEISHHYRGKDRKRRLLANGVPPGPYRILSSNEPTMIGRVWTKDMICYGISDAHLDPDTLFWSVRGRLLVLRVAGRQTYGQYGGVEWLERVPAYELTDVQRRRIYCWRRSCGKGKMRDNQS